MLGSNVLEIAIGMLLIYTILSLICSAITELIAEQLMSLRSKKLDEWIRNALESDEIVKLIYEHPLIRTLTRGHDTSDPRKLPSYIPAQTFAVALFDVATNGAAKTDSMNSLADLRTTIAKIPDANKNVRDLLQSLMVNVDSVSNKEADKVHAAWTNIETWFDNVMEQATAGYKRNLRWITITIGLVVCLAINADSLMLVNALANDPAVRSIVVDQAAEFVANPPAQVQPSATATTPEATPEPTANGNTGSMAATGGKSDNRELIAKLQQDLSAIGLFGWTAWDSGDRRSAPTDAGAILYKVLGILITTFAISMGAPFWFDLLNKLVNLRTAGAKPAKAAETEAEADPKADGNS